MFFDDTHAFDVKVTPEGRSTNTNSFTADDRPEAETKGAIKLAEGFYRFPVHSKAKHANITIENNTPFDSSLPALSLSPLFTQDPVDMARYLKSMKEKVVEATAEHVERIYPFLRKVDKLEVAQLDTSHAKVCSGARG